MTPPDDESPADARSEFEKLGEHRQASLVEEVAFFLRENKKWWLIPIFVALGLLALLAALVATGAAPFIYTLF